MAAEIPRQLIPWFPTIDYDLCIGDEECFKFCKNQVFTWDGPGNRPLVTNPYNCVVGCQACINVCTVDAIAFPSKEELRDTLRRLRSELATAKEPAA